MTPAALPTRPAAARAAAALAVAVLAALLVGPAAAQDTPLQPVVPPELRGQIQFERLGQLDANRLRTRFYNFGMVGDFPPDANNVDLSVFHSAEAPRGTGMNYSDGITPFVLSAVTTDDGATRYVMETGFRERQPVDPQTNRQQRFEPRPGYFNPDPNTNAGRSVAVSNDPRTWPDNWIDKLDDPDDPGWSGSWNGYFGKRPAADLETFFVMDDQAYAVPGFFPDARDPTRRGLGLRVEVRGFQWANPQAQDVIFWHYDIVNESTTDYEDIVFGLYMDSGVGGSGLSCDGIFESDDDNAFYDSENGVASDLDLVYTWDNGGRGVDLRGNCSPTGYLGYAYLETPGNPFDGLDNDGDGITDERRDNGPGQRVEGQDAIRAEVLARYDLAAFEDQIGPLEERPAFAAGVWFTGDEDLDWVAEFHDLGADGVAGTDDTGEGDGVPTDGEPNVDRTDLEESDQIGLTGFKYNRIRPGAGNPSQETDGIVFFDDGRAWPRRLYEQFTAADPDVAFDEPLATNYNIAFLFASGPFRLPAGDRQRFSLALAYGPDLIGLRQTVRTVGQIYDANYQFAVPPPTPTLRAEAGDGRVTLYWDDVAERGIDPVTNENDFEGYRVYRSTDPGFLDARRAGQTNPRGNGPIGLPVEQFDLRNGVQGFSDIAVEGEQYWLGTDSGIRHSFVDSTVTNGQLYYYAVTAYDRGSPEDNFSPSENAAAVSRTPRGGTILPSNVVEVRPEPRVPGYVGATTAAPVQVAGDGVGTVGVLVVESDAVPDGHTYRLTFESAPDSVRAERYVLTDVTTGEVLFETGADLSGAGVGLAARGLLPVVDTPREVAVDEAASGFTPGSRTDVVVQARYAPALPRNLRRPGYPEDLRVEFADVVVDTSLAAIGQAATPARFRVVGAESGLQLDFRFRDLDGDLTLGAEGEFVEVVTYAADRPTSPRATWRLEVPAGGGGTPPGRGDAYVLRLDVPFSRDDVFEFTTAGARVDAGGGDLLETAEPYVVPNPYLGAASFEPERFAVSGRGERRVEFRNVPQNATVRIYTVRGALVQTLTQDGSTAGAVPWDLRTRDNLEVAPGLYLYHVEAGAETFVGRLAIVK